MKRYRFDKAELDIIERSPIPFGVYQFLNNTVKTIALSKGCCDLFGFADKKKAYFTMDNDMYRDSHPDDVARISEAALLFATENKDYDVVYRILIGGEYHIVHAYGKHVFTKTGVRLAYVWYNDEGPFTSEDENVVNELRKSFGREIVEGKSDRRMKYDFLTGLPSMTYFFELVDSYRAEARKEGFVPALMSIDLSGMHYFNRTNGFVEGDKLIRAVARTLAEHFSSTCCSRFGQDHFAVVTKLDGIEQVLSDLFEECKNINNGKSLPLRVGIYPDKAEEIQSSACFDRAKIACNVTRKAFFSHFRYFDDSMLKDSEKSRYIISNIDRAIEERLIKVYYQPIIRSANWRVCEEEALARWIDPENGFISPAEFIPVLEDAKLISKLDLFVVDEVLDKMKKQAEEGLYVVPVSVNLSRADFDICDMVCEIERRVDAAGIDRGKLTVEITESVIGSDFGFIKEQIDRFKNAGFHVWMDDFGSGYSSLDVLQNVNFDVIKLDMRFVQQLEKNEKSKIILTELADMANGLGLEIVAEGVETKEQAEFLTEIGCAKLQGYFFCKALPLEEIVRRNREGVQIGFENPDESVYYSAIGKLNLYDISAISEDTASIGGRYDVLPMAIFEISENHTAIIRCNNAYKKFAKEKLGYDVEIAGKEKFIIKEDETGAVFMRHLRKCAETGTRFFVNDKMSDGKDIQSVISRVAINPTNGVVACVVAISNFQNATLGEDGITYTSIARALSSDYLNLYYVNVEKDTFSEFSPNETYGNLTIERRGEKFFDQSIKDANEFVYEKDRDVFIASFTKENVMKAIDEHGAFIITYRLLINGVPTYVNMKAIRMSKTSKHIIIGVNSVDAQMKQQEALERVKEERITYARINALSGDYICIYTVDPETDKYFEYSATSDYEGLGISKEGEDFFAESLNNSLRLIYIDDIDLFREMFTKENVMSSIEEKGMFIMNYRLVFDGEPKYVCLKAAMITEKDGPQLIIGITIVDDQVRRDMEYAKNLTLARAKADTDALTGVKNKHAYIDVEQMLNDLINKGEKIEFAIVVFDVNGLKKANDEIGHSAGDELLKSASKLICDVFCHSPVFRIGGDEFAVIARGQDYLNIDKLMRQFRKRVVVNKEKGDVVVASGMAKYDGEKDMIVVFEKADAVMYKNKKQLKKQ